MAAKPSFYRARVRGCGDERVRVPFEAWRLQLRRLWAHQAPHKTSHSAKNSHPSRGRRLRSFYLSDDERFAWLSGLSGGEGSRSRACRLNRRAKTRSLSASWY